MTPMIQEPRIRSHKPSLMGQALLALQASGACRVAPKSLAGMGVIFMLHRVRPDDGADFAPNRILEITPHFLEETIGFVQEQGYRCLSLDEAVSRIEAGDRSERFAVFTLDDGYKDNLTDALPVFERTNTPFTVYLTTGLPDGQAEIWWVALERAIANATAIAVKLPDGAIDLWTRTTEEKPQAAEQGLLGAARAAGSPAARGGPSPCIGTRRRHGRAHPRTRDDVGRRAEACGPPTREHRSAYGGSFRASLALDAHDARIDIERGMTRMEAELGRRPTHFSYPYGDPASAGERDFMLAEALGFRSATTTRKGVVHPQHARRMHALPRLSLNGDYQDRRMLEALLSGLPFALARPIRSLGID